MKTIEMNNSELTVVELTKLAKKGVVILTNNGRPVVSVTNLAGRDWESISLVNNPRFLDLIEESRRSYREQGGTGIGELRRELGLRTKRKAAGQKKRSRAG